MASDGAPRMAPTMSTGIMTRTMVARNHVKPEDTSTSVVTAGPANCLRGQQGGAEGRVLGGARGPRAWGPRSIAAPFRGREGRIRPFKGGHPRSRGRSPCRARPSRRTGRRDTPQHPNHGPGEAEGGHEEEAPHRGGVQIILTSRKARDGRTNTPFGKGKTSKYPQNYEQVWRVARAREQGWAGRDSTPSRKQGYARASPPTPRSSAPARERRRGATARAARPASLACAPAGEDEVRRPTRPRASTPPGGGPTAEGAPAPLTTCPGRRRRPA